WICVPGLPWHIMSRWPCSKNKHSRIKTKPSKRWNLSIASSNDKGLASHRLLAHARRKFYELHVANQSEIAAQALASFKALYAIEAEAKDLTAKEREQRRQEKARQILEKLHDWMLAQRTLVPDGSGTAKALDYSLKRWAALTRYLEDGCVPIDNNHIEQQIRPLALGRKNW